MKNVMFGVVLGILLMGIFSVSLVLADSDNGNEDNNSMGINDSDIDDDSGLGETERERIRDRINESLQERKMLKAQVMNYYNSSKCPEDCKCSGSVVKCEGVNGREITVIAGKSGNVILQSKGVNVSTRVMLMKNGSELCANLSGECKKIKYPDEVKEKVLERLRLRNCSECNLSLNDDGEYEMQLEREGKFLGLFKTKVKVRTMVNAENGEVVRVKKSWWAFLASEPSEN